MKLKQLLQSEVFGADLFDFWKQQVRTVL